VNQNIETDLLEAIAALKEIRDICIRSTNDMPTDIHPMYDIGVGDVTGPVYKAAQKVLRTSSQQVLRADEQLGGDS